jgi:cytochrome b involved in lipid metabolism
VRRLRPSTLQTVPLHKLLQQPPPLVSGQPSAPAKYQVGNRLTTTDSVRTRQNPSTSGTSLGTIAAGSSGTVIGGPTSANGYWWYYVEYANGTKGWSVEDYLAPATTPVTNPDSNTTPNTTTSATQSGVTINTVATHNRNSDCWIIVNNKVYDVTQYIPFHPGGQSRIINNCGTDSTTLFNSSSGGGHNHSSSARTTLANYLLGNVVTDTAPVDPTAPTCTSFTYSNWGTCTTASVQYRTVVTSSPSGCAGGSPVTSQSCTYTAPTSADQPYRDAIDAEYPAPSLANSQSKIMAQLNSSLATTEAPTKARWIAATTSPRLNNLTSLFEYFYSGNDLINQ